MIIGLMGFEFESPNKGCEALSYSLIAFLNSHVKGNLTIYNFSNLGMGNVEKEFPNINFKHIKLKIKDLSLKMIRAFVQCDYVFDVTMGDSFSDIYSKTSCLTNIKFKRIAEIFAKKYVLMPQTYGPFSNSQVLKKAYKVFENADIIFCRDETSQKYIKSEFCIDNSILTTDMAFMLPYKKNLYRFNSVKFKLGLNVSGLLWKGGFENKNQFNLKFDYKDYIEKIIQHYIQEGFEIHLIAHVIDRAHNAHDDDCFACEYLKKKYPELNMAPVFHTPIEAKSYIANMNCFLGARMHSTIGAFSAGIPTIPFSYSRKFEGLFESLNYPYLIHGTQESLEDSIRKTYEYVSMVDVLENTIINQMKIINDRTDVFTNAIMKLIL